MLKFLLKRLFYGLLVLFGINLLTFVLFFVVNTPDDMARLQLGKRVTQQAIEKWKAQRGYDRPLFFNSQAEGTQRLSNTVFFDNTASLFSLRFGLSDTGRNIAADVRARALPSLFIAAPVFALGLAVTIVVALLLVFFRHSYVEFGGMLVAVALMSISSLFFIIGGQLLFARILKLVPVSGFDAQEPWRFVVLPIALGIVAGLGAQTRFFRTLFLEEISRDYVRTARAKGLSPAAVLLRHVLRNALIPILTSSVAVLPLLFMGSLLTESFFSIPGLGSYLVDALASQDFAIVRSMVFIGSALYIIGLILTELSYAWADPRIRLQ